MQYATFQVVDAVLIYRCWVIHSYAWQVICLPLFFWVSSVALSSYDFYVYALELDTTNPYTVYRLSSLTFQIWDGFFACNIIINTYATIAIVYRFVRIVRDSVIRSGRLYQTWHIVAESGALYTFSTVVNLIATALISQDPNYERFQLFKVIADPINFSMAGIAFNLILIRVHQQRKQGIVDQDKSLDLQFVNSRRGRPLSTIQFSSAGEVNSTLSQNHSILHPNTK
ncbi:hypothetical protein AX15_001478 [Amanita polypyramis BW_CC]|nr:hypothetical protein AX15_001478 [Amanita polypyramis BW_CC]